MANSNVGIFFEYGGTVIQIPINPEELQIDSEANNKTEEIVKLGEINVIKDRKLTSVKFSSFFPKDDWFPGIRTLGEFKDCDYYVQFFTKIMKAKKPVRFLVTGMDIDAFFSTDKLVSIEKFDIKHKYGDYEDVYYDIELKEYIDYSIQKVQKVKKTKKPSKITKGCTVIVNGRLHKKSTGKGVVATEKKAVRKVNYIAKGKKYPYHIATLSGKWKGWAAKGSVKLK